MNNIIKISAWVGIAGCASICVADAFAVAAWWTAGDGEGMFGVSDQFFVFLMTILFILPCTIYILGQFITDVAILRSAYGKTEPLSAGAMRKYAARTGGRGLITLLFAFIMFLIAMAMQSYVSIAFIILCVICFILSFVLKIVALKKIQGNNINNY